MNTTWFDADFLQKLECLSLASKRVVQGTLLAQQRSRQLGSGMEFADHRPYTAAEDFRYLDWNAYARLETLLVKRFQEEQDLSVYLLLDCSRSMELGQPTKFDYARRVVAALAYIALADLDRVAVTTFAGGLAAEFPPTRGKDRILGLMRFLDGAAVQPQVTDLAASIAAFIGRTRRRGLVVVVSDFFDRAGFRAGLDLLRYHGFDVHLVQVYDPSESDPAMRGDVELLEVERQTRRKVTVNESGLARYRELFRAHGAGLDEYCRRYGFGCTRTDTGVAFDDLVMRLMRQAGTVQ